MNGKERALACLTGHESDRPAVINPTSIATFETCQALGICFQDTHLDADKMAAVAAFGATELGFDSVMPYFSVIQEAAALGCDINWGGPKEMPTQKKPPYLEPEEFILPDNFLDLLPIRTVLDSLTFLKREIGEETLIIGKAMGPWTLSYHLHGVEDTLSDTLLEEERLLDFINKFYEVTITFAQAQFDAGADVITIADHITADLTGPNVYEKFLMSAHRKIIQKLGSERLIFHCCGNTIDRLALFAEAGWNTFHFDSKNDIGEAISAAGKMKLTGCVNNVNVLLNGSPDDVGRQVRILLDHGIKMISPECAIPLAVKNENLSAIKKHAELYSS